MAAKSVAEIPRPRPVLVWICSAYYLVGALLSGYSIANLLADVFSSGEATPQYVGGYGDLAIVVLRFATVGVFYLLSGFALFRLRKSAPYLATASFLLGLVQLRLYGPSNLLDGHVQILIGQLLVLVVTYYSWRLLRNGTLR